VHLGDDWFCSSECLASHTERVLASAGAPVPRWVPPPAARVGHLLVSQGVVSRDMLELALRDQRHTGKRLGAQLLGMGLISREELLRALAAQAGTGYLVSLDPRRVAAGPGGLSRQTVRALGVVPFERSSDGERLAVACVAPLPRAALSALREITGARIDAFIVADEDWEPLATAYASGAAEIESLIPSTTLRSIPDAVVRIALAAAEGGPVRIQHARCDPFMWVRLEQSARREDLLVSLGASEGEQPWPAAPTQH
jgi:hypothetical protein